MAEENPGDDRLQRLFRGEKAVSSLDLRVDVADDFARATGSDDIVVDERLVDVYGDLTCVRGDYELVVHGDYERDTDNQEIMVLTNGAVNEEVLGDYQAWFAFESEAIMGGGYTSFNAGLFVRTVGIVDHLCWGGWVEAEGARVDITGHSAFRMYFGYAHTVGARLVRVGRAYVDDFLTRNEHFGSLQDLQTSVTHTGSPGSGTVTEM